VGKLFSNDWRIGGWDILGSNISEQLLDCDDGMVGLRGSWNASILLVKGFPAKGAGV
jgi:hypothetical protein